MTAQILSSELSTLIHESKRKNTELRNVRASTNSKPSTIDTLLTFPCRSQRNLFKTSRLYQPLPNPNLRQVSSTLSLLLISSTDGERSEPTTPIYFPILDSLPDTKCQIRGLCSCLSSETCCFSCIAKRETQRSAGCFQRMQFLRSFIHL